MKLIKYFILVFSLILSGCNLTKDGIYTFSHIEYKENNKIKTTDCNNLEELPIGVKTICDCKDMKMELNGNAYTFSMTPGHIEGGYFKITNNDIYLSAIEDGNWYHNGWFHYKNNKIYYGINETYVVLKR